MKDILCRLTESLEWLVRDGFITSARNASDAADEIKQLRAEVATLKEQLAAAQKDSERYVKGWSHGCNVLMMEIELWIPYCPHCGRPAPIDAALAAQEVKS